MTRSADTSQTDVAIIGAGTAGMAAYRAALRHTERVVLIESHVYGTTCARVGCMPSKLLIAAAEAAHSARHAGRFGVNVPQLHIDGRAVMARVRSERDRFVGFVVDTVQHWPAEHRWQGHARFIDGHTLVVAGPGGERRLQAGRIVIATGSRPSVPSAWRALLGERLIVNDDVFDWTDLPSSVAVVGAGVIGLELAQALHRLGVRVRLYGRSRKAAYVVSTGNTATGSSVPTVLDLVSGAVVNAATLSNGTVGNGRTTVSALLSRDGKAAAFDNNATNLLGGLSPLGGAELRAYRKLLP